MVEITKNILDYILARNHSRSGTTKDNRIRPPTNVVAIAIIHCAVDTVPYLRIVYVTLTPTQGGTTTKRKGSFLKLIRTITKMASIASMIETIVANCSLDNLIYSLVCNPHLQNQELYE